MGVPRGKKKEKKIKIGEGGKKSLENRFEEIIGVLSRKKGGGQKRRIKF